MSLKCPYLARFAITDLAKNASSIWQSAPSCPFMLQTIRKLSDDTRFKKSNKKKNLN